MRSSTELNNDLNPAGWGGADAHTPRSESKLRSSTELNKGLNR